MNRLSWAWKSLSLSTWRTQAALLMVSLAEQGPILLQQHRARGCEVRVCRKHSILCAVSPPNWLCLVLTEGIVFRQKSGDCRFWGKAGKPVIYSSWTWQHTQENMPLLLGCATGFCKWKNNTCLVDCPVFYSWHQRKVHPTQAIPIASHTGFKVPLDVSDCSGLGCQMWGS